MFEELIWVPSCGSDYQNRALTSYSAMESEYTN